MKRPSANIGIAATTAVAPAAPELAEAPKSPKIDGGGGTGATGGTQLETEADSGATTEIKELMPFKRQKTRDSGNALQRRKTAAMEDYLQTLPEGDGEGEDDHRDRACDALEVTAENIAVNLRVTRGPDWNWGDEDGGEGRTGVILSFDKAKAIAQVLWEGGQAHKHYRFGHMKSDLIISTGAANSTLGRRNSQLFFQARARPSSFLIGTTPYFPQLTCVMI